MNRIKSWQRHLVKIKWAVIPMILVLQIIKWKLVCHIIDFDIIWTKNDIFDLIIKKKELLIFNNFIGLFNWTIWLYELKFCNENKFNYKFYQILNWYNWF